MNVTCSRGELHEALRIASGVVDPNAIKQACKDVRLRTVDNTIELAATDMEVGIKILLRNAKVRTEGGIAVPAEPFNKVMSESRDEQITLKVGDSILTVEGKSSWFRIPGLAAEEFPDVPDFPANENALEIEGAILKEMIEKTIFAVSLEKQRYALTGALLAIKERAARVEMVGTDGHRMALIRRKANSAAPFSASPIIALKALQQMQKMATAEEVIKLCCNERQILMKCERGVLVANLVEGRFPEYREVIPDDLDKRLEIEAHELVSIVRQAAAVTSSDRRAIWLDLKKGTQLAEASDPTLGNARVEFTAKYEGEPIRIQFNPDFLLDGLKAVGDQVIRFELKDPSRAAVMRAGADYLYLVMPILQE